MRWTLLAFLSWFPWLWNLQSKGGYAAVKANHSGYVVGLSGWWHSLTMQALKLQRLDAWLSCSALIIVLVASLVFVSFSNRRSSRNVLSVAIWLVLSGTACIAFGPTGALAVVALGGVIGVHWPPDQASRVGLAITAQWLDAGSLVFWPPGNRTHLHAVPSSHAPVADGLLAGRWRRRQCRHAEDWFAVCGRKTTPKTRLVFTLSCGSALGGSRRRWLSCGNPRFMDCRRRTARVPGWQPRTSLAVQTPQLVEAACRSTGSCGLGSSTSSSSTRMGTRH